MFIFTLALAIVGQVMFRGFAAAMALLIAIVSGYVLAMIMGLVDFSAVTEASVFALPAFMAPKFNLGAIIIIIPASLTVLSEHISHQIVTSEIVERSPQRCGTAPFTAFRRNLNDAVRSRRFSPYDYIR